MKKSAEYHVVYYREFPETGEVVAVGLIFKDRGKITVKHDPKFARAAKIFPTIHCSGLKFVFEEIQKSLSESRGSIESLGWAEPNFLLSRARQVVSPISEEIVNTLYREIVAPPVSMKRVGSTPRRAKPKKAEVANSLRDFIAAEVSGSLALQTMVSPVEIFGENHVDLKPVAVAIQKQDSWTLIDGVNLNLEDPRNAKTAAESVARNFWHIRRVSSETLGKTVNRIGIILNGSSHLNEKERVAHDYALDQLRHQADSVYDVASPKQLDDLRARLLA